MGHTVRLIAPQLAKPYVKSGKNDAADAEALCEAASRPTMRFVPVKTADQQATLMLATMRDRLVRERTRLASTIRGHVEPGGSPDAAEFGLVAPTSPARVAPLLADVQADATLPQLVRELFAELAAELTQLEARLAVADKRLMGWHRASATSRRLAAVPGIGPITATLLTMKTPDPHAVRSG